MTPAFALAAALSFHFLCVSAGQIEKTASNDTKRGEALFEKHVLPLLKENCFRCHSHEAKKSRGGLVVDSRNALLEGGDTGPALVPGKPAESLLVKAICYTDEELRMPPKGKLAEQDIKFVQEWIALGAPDPRRSGVITPRKSFKITEADRRHWSFQPVAKVEPPTVEDESWCRSEIDRFILAQLARKGFRPSERANRHTLLRRLTFDLIGLPPTPAEIEAFVSDASPTAYEKVVDRLLASKEFGVRWARHWLDGVRYATDVDQTGTYRNWVVKAFNNDLPYDEFVRLQIAGDLIPAKESDPTKIHVSGASLDGISATGMLALAVWERVARDLAVAEIVDTQIDVVGRRFLGMTLACARCHDHKFDPISQKDYYALSGIFFSSHISPGKIINDGRLSSDVIQVPLLNKVDAEKNRQIDEKVKGLKKQIAGLEKKAGPAAKLKKIKDELKTLSPKLAKAKGAAKTKLEKQVKSLRGKEEKLLKDREKNNWPLNPPELAEIAALQKQVAKLQQTKVVPTMAICTQEGGVPGAKRAKIGDAPLLIRGDFRKEGEIVPRRFPLILAGEEQTPIGKRTKGSGRLELANWIASEDNPLTARVMVNRIWLHLFGEGLVRTPDNFGRLGKPPTHPKLLDYLTRRFIDSGWSVKQLIREIVLSGTYQQSSFAGAELLKADPENKLLGRMNRKRLEYEALRDSILQASGQLKIQGGKHRRTLYEPVLRGRMNQTRMMFDGPDPHTIVPERPTTTTTTQALYLMNSPFVIQAAKRMADRLQKNVKVKDDADRIRKAYLLLVSRPPAPEEIQIGQAYLDRGALANYLQLLMCTNEFIYLD